MRGAYDVIAAENRTCIIGSSPHAWGIHKIKRGDFVIITGSSPHAWGILSVSKYIFAPISVHPHMRGAYNEQDMSHRRF